MINYRMFCPYGILGPGETWLSKLAPHDEQAKPAFTGGGGE
jgi:hypothetical protein